MFVAKHRQSDRTLWNATSAVLRKAMPLVLLSLAPAAFADTPAKKINYQDDILPMLRNSCLNCHNPDKKKAGLDLSSYQGAMKGSDDNKVIVPGDASASKLFRCITQAEEPFMPQKADKLPDKELSLYRDWIAAGALETSGSKVAVATGPKNSLTITANAALKPSGPPPMPEGLPLEPVIRAPHQGALTSLAASPWAPLAAVGSEHQVLLYNTDTQNLLGVLPFAEGLPYVLQFSRNGSLLLAAGGQSSKSGKVVLWDVKSGKRVAEIGDEFDAVLAADINADQSMVALGGPSKVLKGFTTKDGQMAYAIKKHTDWVMAAAFSPDGVLLGSGDRAGNVYIFEAHTGRDFYTLAGHKEAITAVAFRDDSNVFASASQDGTIKLWDMQNGNPIKSWTAHGGGVLSIAFAHDGRIVSTGRDNTTKVWTPDGATGKAVDSFSDIALHAVFTHDANKVISGDWTGQIHINNTADGAKAGVLSANPPTAEEVAKHAAELEANKKKLADAGNNLNAAKTEFAARQADQAKATEAAKTTKTAADALTAQLAQLDKTIAPLAAQLKVKQDQVAKLNEAVSAANVALEAAKKPIAEKEPLIAASADLANKLKASADKTPANQVLVEASAKAAATLDALKRDLSAAQQDIVAKTAQQKKASDDLAAAQVPMNKDKADLDAAQANLAKLRDESGKATAGAAAAAAAVDPAGKAVIAAQAKVTDLTAQLDKLQKELPH